MARETAHQLGTPISSLIGWLEWLKNKPEQQEKILDDISIDVDWLHLVSDSFCYLCSDSQLDEILLSKLIDNIRDQKLLIS